MGFALPPNLPPAQEIVREREQWVEHRNWNSDLLYFDSTRQLIGKFRVGDVVYALKRPLEAIFEPAFVNAEGRFFVSELASLVIGRGNDLNSAKKDWELQIDAHIQKLLSKQDFERTDEDDKAWEQLNRFFNLPELKYSTPFDVRIYGKLVKVRGHQRFIKWIDGTKSKFDRNRIPADMVSFEIGQPFEAVVKRDPRTWKILKIASAFPASDLPEVTDEELEQNVPSIKERDSVSWG
ncbi:MAG: hypothetical protein AAGA30_09360 [Planctomycetota bacterium]